MANSLKQVLRAISAGLLACISAHAQIALVGTIGAAGVSTATTSSLTTTGANFIAVCYAGAGSSPNETISDSLGNSYALASTNTAGGELNDLWIKFGPAVGAAQTFTAASTNNNPTLNVMAFSGVANGPESIVTGFASGGPTVSTSALTPQLANELLVSCLGTNYASSSATVTINSPMTLGTFTFNPATSYNMISASAYQIQTTASTVTPTWQSSNGHGTLVLAGAFRSTETPGTLTIGTNNLPSGNLTVPYDTCLAATGGDSPYTWTETAGTLPAGLSLSGGCITGTPTATGTSSGLIFKVVDSASNGASTSSLSIVVDNAPPVITSGTCAGGTQYTAYSGCTMAATGGTPPYTWTAQLPGGDSGIDPLPEGMTVNASTGVISSSYILGMGTYKTVITLTDSVGDVVTQSRSIAINGDTSFLTNPPFPSDSIWSQSVVGLPIDTSPAASSLPNINVQAVFGSNVDDGGIPVIKVPSRTPFVSTIITGTGTGYMFNTGPWLSGTPVEGGGTSCEQNGGGNDCHSLVVLENSSGAPASLYEMYQAQQSSSTSWESASQGVLSFSGYGVFAQDSGDGTDAAGLPVAPYLANYDAVMSPTGQRTAFRFTLPSGYERIHHVWPATGQAGGGKCSGGYEDSNNLISQLNPPTSCPSGRVPFGEIYRITTAAYNSPPAACLTDFVNYPESASMFRTMRNYGIINADNGGGKIYVVGTSDARWNDTDLACLSNLTGADFEPIKVEQLAKDWPGTSTDYPDLGTSQAIAPGSATSGKLSLSGNVKIQ